MAMANYPLLKQMALIDKTMEYTIENAAKGYLPQISINGQATYQSDVTTLPISIPNVKVPALSKDQYKIYAEINQSLTDALVIKQQQELMRVNTASERQKLEIELYKLKERINQLYFGILLINAQMEQIDLFKKDIQSAITKTNAALANGVAFKNSLNVLEVELLKTEQRNIELVAAKKGYMEMLSIFIHQSINENTKMQVPVAQSGNATINRPELKLYEIQRKGFNIQNNLITAKNLPRLGLFFQGGYGRPALNVLKNDFTAYYITGIRFNWSLSGFYTFKKDKQLLSLSQSTLDIQKETFLFNTEVALSQQNNEIGKYQALIESDKEIVSLQSKIKNSAHSQLENGTISTNDYMAYLNAEDRAKQNLTLHQIQLLMSKINYQTTSGN
jgi:outer membrane protein TolC